MHIDKIRKGELSRGVRSKMRPRSERGVLLGHAMGASAYAVYLPRLNKIVTSSAVVFDTANLFARLDDSGFGKLLQG